MTGFKKIDVTGQSFQYDWQAEEDLHSRNINRVSDAGLLMYAHRTGTRQRPALIDFSGPLEIATSYYSVARQVLEHLNNHTQITITKTCGDTGGRLCQ